MGTQITALVQLGRDGNPPPATLPQSIIARSEGVRMPFGQVRKVQKVIGVRSLCVFLAISYKQLAVIIHRATGRAYTKSALSTWAMVEKRSRMPSGWFKKYWMPDCVAETLKRFLRDYVHWVTDGRYAVRVSGAHRWSVQLRRVV